MPDLTKLRYEDRKKSETTIPPDVGDYADIDRSTWKSFVMVAITTLTIAALSLLVKDYFFDGTVFKLSDLQYAIAIGVASVFFASFFFLQSLFTKSFGRLFTMTLVNAAGLVAPFYDRISNDIWVGAGVIFAALLLAGYTAQHELSLLLRVKLMRLAGRSIPRIMTALALFISLVFYLNITEGRTNILTRDLLGSLAFNPAEKLVVRFVPEFSFQKDPHTIFTDLATKQLEAMPEAKQLSPLVKKALIGKSVAESEERVQGFTDYPIDMKARVDDQLYGYLVSRVTGQTEGSRQLVGASAAVLAFTIFKLLGIAATIAASILSFLLFEMCAALDFATIVLESRTREIIVLK